MTMKINDNEYGWLS